MPVPLSRIGKALLKFFKPIRVTPPHHPGQQFHSKSGQGGALPSSFRVIKLDKSGSGQQAAESAAAVSKPATEEVGLPEVPQKSPAHWLDLVIYLLGACRRASDKMRRRSGIETYQKALMNKGKSKLKAVGNIIDTEKETA